MTAPRGRVFIVDKDRARLRYLIQNLEFSGFDVRGTVGGDVLQELRLFSAEVVLVDTELEGHHAFMVARQLRSYYGGAKPRLIAMSSNKKEDQELARLAGFDYLLPKPCDPRVLALLAVPPGELTWTTPKGDSLQPRR